MGTAIAWPDDVRVLEARFHNRRNGSENDFIVVAHLVWKARRLTGLPLVRPAASLEHSANAATTLIKLHFLVTNAAPDVFERLQVLRSRFWSFVEVAGGINDA